MLNSEGFDLWAGGYDRSVQMSDEENSYPFAGYKRVLGMIYASIREMPARRVLDIGLGTGILAGRLYRDGCHITGIDFSDRMLQIAREKMPDANLIRHDFSTGIPYRLQGEIFDAIVCTYAIHHLPDPQKAPFLAALQEHLAPGGKIFIGDVAFSSRSDLDACRRISGDEWDDEEFYPVADEILPLFPGACFEPISFCSGILTLSRP